MILPDLAKSLYRSGSLRSVLQVYVDFVRCRPSLEVAEEKLLATSMLIPHRAGQEISNQPHVCVHLAFQRQLLHQLSLNLQ